MTKDFQLPCEHVHDFEIALIPSVNLDGSSDGDFEAMHSRRLESHHAISNMDFDFRTGFWIDYWGFTGSIDRSAKK